MRDVESTQTHGISRGECPRQYSSVFVYLSDLSLLRFEISVDIVKGVPTLIVWLIATSVGGIYSYAGTPN